MKIKCINIRCTQIKNVFWHLAAVSSKASKLSSVSTSLSDQIYSSIWGPALLKSVFSIKTLLSVYPLYRHRDLKESRDAACHLFYLRDPYLPDNVGSGFTGCHKGKKLSERTTRQHELFQVRCWETAAYMPFRSCQFDISPSSAHTHTDACTMHTHIPSSVGL